MVIVLQMKGWSTSQNHVMQFWEGEAYDEIHYEFPQDKLA